MGDGESNPRGSKTRTGELNMTSINEKKSSAGFTIVEMIITMTIMLTILGLVMTLFARSFQTRQRESSRTDAQTAAQAALNVLSREIANSGYGLIGNGIVLPPDSGIRALHFISNVRNINDVLTDPSENVTYFFEPGTQSILRHDAHANGVNRPETSIIINRISDVQFQYFNYIGSNPVPTISTTPTINTGRVRITITVSLDRIINQVNPSAVVLTSDVTLRNSDYMLRNY